MPKNKKCQGLETFQRLNYLLQIRNFAALNAKNSCLSTYYGHLIDGIAKKSVLRIDPLLKKQTCKKCKNVLLPGTTANVKKKSSKKLATVVWKCEKCGFVRRYPVRREKKKIWYDNPDSLVELIDYSKKQTDCTPS